jgi:hypothetical protein
LTDITNLHVNVLSSIEGVLKHLNDTLNIKNGLNYAQFLEALLRIAFNRADEYKQSYAATLEEIFTHPKLIIANRIKDDPFLAEVYDSEENTAIFFKYEDLLNAIFTTKAMPGLSYIELEKTTLVQLLKECGIIKTPQVKKAEPVQDGKKKNKQNADKKEEEKKDEPVIPPEELYLEADCTASIEPVCSFDDNKLNYFDMLECLLRVRRDYKWNTEQKAILTSPSQQLEYLMQLLEKKFENLIP